MMRHFKKKLLLITLLVFLSMSIIGLKNYIFADDTLSVTATVPPKSTDFQFEFISPEGSGTFTQYRTLNYHIQYGSYSSAGVTTTTTIIADFSADMAPDGTHVVDYVIGSASNAYGNAAPVIDQIHRTITWVIPSLPPGMQNQLITFQLRTNSNFRGKDAINFTTIAKMSNEYLTMPDQSISQNYQFDANYIEPTSVPSPSPTKSQTPTPTPSIAPVRNTFSINDISITDLSSSSATISITTSILTKSRIIYGLNQNNLSNTVSVDQYAFTNNLTLVNLLADTNYFFKVLSTDKNGSIINSDIYIFRTAKKSEPIVANNAAASIISQGNTIFSRIIDKNYSPGFALLTDNTDYAFNYSYSNSGLMNSLNIIIKNKNKLAENPTTIAMNQKTQQLFVAHTRTLDPGIYEIFVSAEDIFGNITQSKILELKVTPKLSVASLDDHLPIGDARVFIYYLNPKTGNYEPITETFGNIKNPQFTDKNGELNLILPEGKYKAKASAFWYAENSTEFALGPQKGQDFPKIYLKKDPYNIISFIQNIKDFLLDSFSNLKTLTSSLSSSIRFFNITALVISVFTLISFIFFFLRTHINLKHLPVFFLFNINLMQHKHEQKFIYGSVVDHDHKPISKAFIEVIDSATGSIVSHTTTNRNGHFQILNKANKNSYKLIVTKDGYRPTELIISNQNLPKAGLELTLLSGDEKSQYTSRLGIKVLEHLGGSLFESSLILSIILEIIFMYFFGFARTLPFLILSFINILLWMFYLNGHNEYK